MINLNNQKNGENGEIMAEEILKICKLFVDYLDLSFGITIDEVDIVNFIEEKGEVRCLELGVPN